MNERARGTDAGDPQNPQQRVLFETARALAESATLEDAAPRMLEAVCESLGWECGAVWQVNRARNTLRCVGTWAKPGLPLRGVHGRHRRRTFAIGVGLPGRVWSHREPVWVRDVTSDSNFPRAQVAERGGLHSAFARPDPPGPARGRRAGVLQPRHARTDLAPAHDDDHRVQPDRTVRRAEMGRRGSRPVLQAVAGPVLHRHVRRLLRTPQPGVADGPGIFRRGNARLSVHGLRPSRRSRRHDQGDVGADDRRTRHRLREPLPVRRTDPTSGFSGSPRRSSTRSSSTRWPAT